jgi:hypothetical protein
VAAEATRRDPVTGALVPNPEPDMVFEILIADGADGERLIKQQALILREVTEWLARNRSKPGLDNAA